MWIPLRPTPAFLRGKIHMGIYFVRKCSSYKESTRLAVKGRKGENKEQRKTIIDMRQTTPKSGTLMSAFCIGQAMLPKRRATSEPLGKEQTGAAPVETRFPRAITTTTTTTTKVEIKTFDIPVVWVATTTMVTPHAPKNSRGRKRHQE